MKTKLAILATLIITGCGGDGSETTPSIQHDTNLSVKHYNEKTFIFEWQKVENVQGYTLCLKDDVQENNCGEIAKVSKDITTYSYTPDSLIMANNTFFIANSDDKAALSGELDLSDTDIADASVYLKSDKMGARDYFGSTMALSGDSKTLVVGAPYEGTVADDSGAVDVFTLADNVWSSSVHLKASNAAPLHHFGRSLSLNKNGTVLAAGVSARSFNMPPEPGKNRFSGAVYILTRAVNGDTWAEKMITANNNNTYDNFGRSVSLNAEGTVLAAGGSGSSRDMGTVYVFRKADDWSTYSKVEGSNVRESSDFGDALSLSQDGNVLVVGAPGEYEKAGEVYIFNYENDVWSEKTVLQSPVAKLGDYFGKKVSLSGDGKVLAISASNSVYAFTYKDHNWKISGELNVGSDDNFGSSISLNEDGSILSIGADGYDGTNINSGAVYIFAKDDAEDEWVRKQKLTAKNSGKNNYFGSSVSLNDEGTRLAVGAPYENGKDNGLENSSGAVYFY